MVEEVPIHPAEKVVPLPNPPLENERKVGHLLINSMKNPTSGKIGLGESLVNTEAGKIAMPKAEFLPWVTQLLTSCGIEPSAVDPVPLGEGANHVVFRYRDSSESASVIKIPKINSHATMNAGQDDEANQIRLVSEIFPDHVVPTRIVSGKEKDAYVVIQREVKGKPVSTETITQAQREELHEIMKENSKLIDTHGMSLDIMGMPGFMTWIRKQSFKLIMQKSAFEISNIIVDENTGKLTLIDYDVFRFRNVSLKQQAISRIGFFFNRLLVKHYFHIDMYEKDRKV